MVELIEEPDAVVPQVRFCEGRPEATLVVYSIIFNGKMRYELLNGEIFYTLKEARVILENWRVHYNTVRPHSSLGGLPPAPETIRTELEMVC